MLCSKHEGTYSMLTKQLTISGAQKYFVPILQSVLEQVWNRGGLTSQLLLRISTSSFDLNSSQVSSSLPIISSTVFVGCKLASPTEASSQQAQPKSAMARVGRWAPLLSWINRFDGLMSRWIMLNRCMCSNPRKSWKKTSLSFLIG